MLSDGDYYIRRRRRILVRDLLASAKRIHAQSVDLISHLREEGFLARCYFLAPIQPPGYAPADGADGELRSLIRALDGDLIVTMRASRSAMPWRSLRTNSWLPPSFSSGSRSRPSLEK